MPLGFGFQLGHGQATSSAAINIYKDSDIVRTFSEAVQPATVTNVGDGSGSFELYNDTDDAWVAGALSTSDNIQWTFNPTSDFAINDRLTLHLKDTILTVVGSASYEGPFEVKYNVINRLPVMGSLVVDATSADGLIGIVSIDATDLDGQSMTFGLSLTDSSSTVTEYKTEAAWISSGFPSGLPEGTTDQVTPVYAFAKDTSSGISTDSATDSCTVTVPDVTDPVMDAFTVPSTGTTATIPISTLSATDNVTTEPNLLYQVNETDTFTSGVGTWKSSAQWIADGYPSSVSEGDPPTLVTLYTAAQDEATNISTSLTDSSTLTIPHTPAYSEQPTIADTLYDGCTFTVTATDASHTIDFDLTDDNESTWDVGVKTNITSGVQQTITADGLSAGTIANLIKTRIYDNSGGTTDQLVSSYLASFATAKPTLTSVTPSDLKNTLVFADVATDTADSFTIKWGFSSGVLTETPITSATSPYEHTGLTNGTEYFYEVVAIKGGLTSTASTEKSGTPQESTVTRFGASVYSQGGSATITAGGSEVRTVPSGFSGVATADWDSAETKTSYNLTVPLEAAKSGTTAWDSALLASVPGDKVYAEIVLSGMASLNFQLGIGLAEQLVKDSFLGATVNGWSYSSGDTSKYHNGLVGTFSLVGWDSAANGRYCIAFDKTAGEIYMTKDVDIDTSNAAHKLFTGVTLP